MVLQPPIPPSDLINRLRMRGIFLTCLHRSVTSKGKILTKHSLHIVPCPFLVQVGIPNELPDECQLHFSTVKFINQQSCPKTL